MTAKNPLVMGHCTFRTTMRTISNQFWPSPCKIPLVQEWASLLKRRHYSTVKNDHTCNKSKKWSTAAVSQNQHRGKIIFTLVLIRNLHSLQPPTSLYYGLLTNWKMEFNDLIFFDVCSNTWANTNYFDAMCSNELSQNKTTFQMTRQGSN